MENEDDFMNFNQQFNEISQLIRNKSDSHDTSNILKLKHASSSTEPKEVVAVEDAPQLKTFTLESAYQQIGGFGRFQIFAMFIFCVIRNMGQYQVYGFGLAMEPQKYDCKRANDTDWQSCDVSKICEDKANMLQDLQVKEVGAAGERGGGDLEYRLSTDEETFIENWYYKLDLQCESTTNINKILSFYFIGYGLGFIFFFFPNRFGRKKSMIFALFFQNIGCALSLFSDVILVKQVGFFMQGFFHMKSTLSFNYLAEFMPQRRKVLSTTALTAFDASTLLFASAYL
mmetsp:Transcript_2742/g.4689  ORF Transcript_2742/g.4689 Transcript_2742/m.4689 type:complete len:286 (+) Transcript_2742:262-1119(+)